MRSTCASTVISATCRRYVDLPVMLGPVISAKLEHSARPHSLVLRSC